jgi:hypothetical protein
MLIEYKVPLYDAQGVEQFDDDGELIIDTRTGNLLHWGVRTTIDEATQQAMTNTMAVVEDIESSQIIMLSPEEITVI